MKSIQENRYERIKKTSLQKRQEEGDLKAVLELPQGRRYLITLISRLKYFDDNMTGNSQTFENLGQHKAASMILTDIHTLVGENEARNFTGDLYAYRYRRNNS